MLCLYRYGRVNYVLARRLELLREVARLQESLDVPGDVSYTCETAGHFYLYQVRLVCHLNVNIKKLLVWLFLSMRSDNSYVDTLYFKGGLNSPYRQTLYTQLSWVLQQTH